MLPLTVAKAGEQLTIARVGGNPETKKHLEDLGFVAGAVISVVSSNDGDIIVSLKESRLAITEQMAAKIMVQIN